MLTKLIIKNVALIDNVEIPFNKGLNVLSGETGSGKSVIIESLNFVLGAKADKTLIRSGENECMVSAVFDVKNNKNIENVFLEFDFEPEDDLIITRKFNLDGKSNIKINGNTASVSMLKKFTAFLVDVHGQSEHFYLLKKSNQLDLIDAFSGEKGADLKLKTAEKYAELKENQRKIDELGGDEQSRLMRLDVLDYQINEISCAELKDGEEEELAILKQKLLNFEKIANALSMVKQSISEEGCSLDLLSNSNKVLSGIASLNEDYQKLSDRLTNAVYELEDIADTAENMLNEFDLGDIDVNFVEERLDLIKSLKRKYGANIQEILKYLDDAVKEKEDLENFNETNQKLLNENQKIKEELFALYEKLSSARRLSAKEFAKNVLVELKDLGMEKARFEIEFAPMSELNDCKFSSPNGIDDIEFKFSANLGEPVKPLSFIISGGEASRFMLAIKTQAISHNGISTFIFDEIDAGISGKIAKTVAEKFAKISKNNQIIAITHLPQISAMADNNLLIFKTETNGKTKTQVETLSSERKIEEIIRLVGGNTESQSARSHAQELINEAEQIKNSL